MNKYIVKNCPANILSPYVCALHHIKTGKAKDCEDITNCIIKQTIDILLREKNNPFELPILDEEERIHKCGKNELAREILQKFEIEEIENEK